MRHGPQNVDSALMKDKTEVGPPRLSFIGRCVHKQPSSIQALIAMKMPLDCFFPPLCLAESHYNLHCSNHVKGLLMQAGGTSSVRPLRVSDGNHYCDPQPVEIFVQRYRGKGLV